MNKKSLQTFARPKYLLLSIVKFMDWCIKSVIKILIYFYKYTFSFWLGRQCRFDPTCSEYAITALNYYSFPKALFLIIKRVLSCHPFYRKNEAIIYDPVKNK